MEPNLTVARHAATRDLLGAFALGAVDAEEAATVRAHLATCAECQAEMAELWLAVDSLPGMIELVRRIRQEGISLLIIEHNLKVITDVTDRLVMLHLGEKIQDGPPLEVVSNPVVIEIYVGGAAALR